MSILQEKKVAIILSLIVMLVGSIAYFGTGAYLMGYDEEEFIRQMIMHHQEAVDNSKIMFNSDNQKIRDLAIRIVDVQQKEIALLESWRDGWYPDNKETRYVPMMPKLPSTPSSERDVSYLKGMIKHHKDAIMMAENVLKTNLRPEVKSLANNIISTQSEEIIMIDSIIKDMKGVLV